MRRFAATHSSLAEPSRIKSSECGSVEAGLAIIPTTLFFLLVLQIVLAGSWQVIEQTRLHNLIVKSEISGDEVAADSLERSHIVVERSEVTGIGELTRYEMRTELPGFSALLPSKEEGLVVRNFAIRIE